MLLLTFHIEKITHKKVKWSGRGGPETGTEHSPWFSKIRLIIEMPTTAEISCNIV